MAETKLQNGTTNFEQQTMGEREAVKYANITPQAHVWLQRANLNIRRTCEIIIAIIFEHFIDHGVNLPHSLGDLCSCEAVDECQELLIKICNRMMGKTTRMTSENLKETGWLLHSNVGAIDSHISQFVISDYLNFEC